MFEHAQMLARLLCFALDDEERGNRAGRVPAARSLAFRTPPSKQDLSETSPLTIMSAHARERTCLSTAGTLPDRRARSPSGRSNAKTKPVQHLLLRARRPSKSSQRSLPPPRTSKPGTDFRLAVLVRAAGDYPRRRGLTAPKRLRSSPLSKRRLPQA